MNPVVTSQSSIPSLPPATDRENPARRPLFMFAAVALVAGWVTLSLPILLDLPQEPFVLITLLVGLVVPALVLTGRESGAAGMRALLRDAVRLPRPLWWGPVAALALPALVWAVASPLGGGEPATASLLVGFTVQFLSSLLIINIWEEMAWTGFVQRRAMTRWGLTRGSILTAFLFAGIHLPLAFYDVEGASDVLLGVALLVSTGIGLRLLIARLDTWSGHSLLTVGILHASFNATYSLIDPSFDWIRLGVTVLLGLAVLVSGRRGGRAGAIGIASGDGVARSATTGNPS